MDTDTIEKLITESETELTEQFQRLDKIALYNQKKVLNSFKQNDIQARHLNGTSGYGYDDIGRDTLCALYASVFKAEKAIVSPNIVSGTHALTLMLFGVLRPNDTLLSISGMPYDTLTDVICGENKGSLADFGIKFDHIDLLKTDNSTSEFELNIDGLTPKFDLKSIEKRLKSTYIKAVFLARSRGYAWRQAINCDDICEIIKFIKKISPKTLVLVDNCYGEFVETAEPTEIGADLVAGSLIKNIGGGIAPTGGYIAGRADLVDQVAYRLTAPSIGMEVGSYISGYQQFYQGLFLAPSVTKNALKSSLLFAKAYEKLGFETLPCGNLHPYDIVTSIKLGSAEKVIGFCGAIQEISPIDSNVTPMPWAMPGYQDEVIMAAGTFVQGASIELSCDAPIKPPYIVYVQGGLTYEHARLALEHTLEKF